MTHTRSISFLLLLLALTGYLLEPSIDWDGIRVDPRASYLILIGLLLAFGLAGIILRKR